MIQLVLFIWGVSKFLSLWLSFYCNQPALLLSFSQWSYGACLPLLSLTVNIPGSVLLCSSWAALSAQTPSQLQSGSAGGFFLPKGSFLFTVPPAMMDCWKFKDNMSDRLLWLHAHAVVFCKVNDSMQSGGFPEI